jgi:hypothetical protein
LSFLYTSPPPKKQTSHFHCPSDSWKSWVQTKSKYLHKWTKRGKGKENKEEKLPKAETRRWLYVAFLSLSTWVPGDGRRANKVSQMNTNRAKYLKVIAPLSCNNIPILNPHTHFFFFSNSYPAVFFFSFCYLMSHH